MNKLVNLYHTLYEDSEETSFEGRNAFWLQYDQGLTVKRQLAFDQYQRNTLFVERELLQLITKINGIDQIPAYMNLMTGKNTASALRRQSDQGILVDQLLTKDLVYFFVLAFAAMDEKTSSEAITLLKKHTSDEEAVNLLMSMDESILNLAMDAYWCSWTFIIGHELFHLNVNESLSFQEEEYAADRNGYQILMNMISAQKAGRIPAHLQVYTEDLYLVPVMCMKYFVWEQYPFPEWFSPEKRIDRIFEMFEDVVPDDVDTETGTDLLNLFLDVLDMIGMN